MLEIIEEIEIVLVGFLPWLKDLGGAQTLFMILIFLMFGFVLFLVVRSAYFTEEPQS